MLSTLLLSAGWTVLMLSVFGGLTAGALICGLIGSLMIGMACADLELP